MIRFRIVFVSGGRGRLIRKRNKNIPQSLKSESVKKEGGVVSEELETFLIFQKFYKLPQKSCGPTPLKFMFSICRKCLLPEKAPTPTPDVKVPGNKKYHHSVCFRNFN